MSRHGRRERAAAFATAWPPGPRAASSGSWRGEARRRGRGGGGEEGYARPPSPLWLPSGGPSTCRLSSFGAWSTPGSETLRRKRVCAGGRRQLGEWAGC
jgi:hypothetical protein